MTEKQDRRLDEIGQELLKLFPRMHGNVYFRFNLKPGRKEVNMNYGTEESKILSRPYPLE